MFPLCHIYFCDRVLDNPSEFEVLGSIYPDAVTSKKLERRITHYNTGKLHGYFMNKHCDMEDFAVGAITHGVDMRGLDFYSDENYPGAVKGYCFEKAKSIADDVVKCCSIPYEWGLWKGHNFIEMAFEIYLNEIDKSLKYRFKNVLENRDIIECVSSNLSNFYNMERDYFEKGFNKFIDFFDYENLNETTMVKRYSIQLKALHGIEDFDLPGAASIIKKAVDMIRYDADDFFDYTTEEVRKIIDAI